MRGDDLQQQAMFSYISPEARVSKDHPLRPIQIMVDNALFDLAPLFKKMYSHTGRPSIPPEQILRGLSDCPWMTAIVSRSTITPRLEDKSTSPV